MRWTKHLTPLVQARTLMSRPFLSLAPQCRTQQGPTLYQDRHRPQTEDIISRSQVRSFAQGLFAARIVTRDDSCCQWPRLINACVFPGWSQSNLSSRSLLFDYESLRAVQLQSSNVAALLRTSCPPNCSPFWSFFGKITTYRVRVAYAYPQSTIDLID